MLEVAHAGSQRLSERETAVYFSCAKANRHSQKRVLVSKEGPLCSLGYNHRWEAGSSSLFCKCEVNCKMSLSVLFRSAWRTALGSFPAS